MKNISTWSLTFAVLLSTSCSTEDGSSKDDTDKSHNFTEIVETASEIIAEQTVDGEAETIESKIGLPAFKPVPGSKLELTCNLGSTGFEFFINDASHYQYTFDGSCTNLILSCIEVVSSSNPNATIISFVIAPADINIAADEQGQLNRSVIRFSDTVSRASCETYEENAKGKVKTVLENHTLCKSDQITCIK